MIHRIFISSAQCLIDQGTLSFVPSPTHYQHLAKSLRLQPGADLLICLPDRHYMTRLLLMTSHTIKVQIVDSLILPTPKAEIILVQCLPKQDKLSEILRACTEIGVSRFIPVISDRTISRPEKKDTKWSRWQTIVESASIQSQRSRIPQLDAIIPLKDLHKHLPNPAQKIVLWESELKSKLQTLTLTATQPIVIVIGPEGGLTAPEVHQLEKEGFVSVGLDMPILRVEHAGLVGIAQVLMLIN